MTLLGTTQTFFGTLLTLTVLQLFYQGKNSENYFIRLIEIMSNDTIKNLDKCTNDIRTYIRQLLQKIKRRKNTAYTNTQIENYCEEITINSSKLTIITIGALSQFQKRLKAITKIETPQLVALYLFFFGLIIMFIDSMPIHNNFITGFISFYFILSVAFLSSLWREYYATSKTLKTIKKKKFKKSIPININPIFISISFSIFVATCIFFLFYSISIYCIMAVIFIVFFSVGLCEEFYHTIDYNRRFILSHIFCILITSISLGILCHWQYSNNLLSYLWDEDKAYIHIFRCLLLLYMIFNLIIIPLIITYLRYREWKVPYFKDLRKIQDWVTEQMEFVDTWEKISQKQNNKR